MAREDWRANIVETDEGVKALLRPEMVIAVVGLKADGPSFMVASALQRAGHQIIPVTPKLDTILGEHCYRKLAELPEAVDIVDVFRASQRVMLHALEVLDLPILPRVFWMQSGIRNDEAAMLLAKAGIKVVQDRCLKVEWQALHP